MELRPFKLDTLNFEMSSVNLANHFRKIGAFETGRTPDKILRYLDCMVVNYIHQVRADNALEPFDSVCGLFAEGKAAFEGSLFKEKTHVQICVRNPENIHGVFRVHDRYFSS